MTYKTQQTFSQIPMRDIVLILSIALIGFEVLQMIFRQPALFVFRQNNYAGLSAIEVLVNSALLFGLYLREANFQARVWFTISRVVFI